jgi:uncharacterized protein YsxB (DUF464 family)
MISVSIEKQEQQYKRIRCSGHAGYDEYGKDIVCAAVSVLVINTINSIDTFTDDTYSVDSDEESGMIDFRFTGSVSDQSNLLIDSLVLGLNEIQKQYGKEYFDFTNEEV